MKNILSLFFDRRCSLTRFLPSRTPSTGIVAQREERWICDQQVVGSNPTWGKAA